MDEERFYEWLEDIPKRLMFSLHIRLVEVRREQWAFTDSICPLPPEVDRRVVDALPPHIQYQRQLWTDNFPFRERRRRGMAEIERFYSQPKTRDNGYGWWFRGQENYARLREKYSGFEEEWAEFYENWKEKCEREGRSVSMDDQMRVAFIRACFLRGKHDGEAAPN